MRSRGALAAAIVLLVSAQSLSGCTSIFAANVPEDVLTGGWHENMDRRDEQRSFLGLGYNQATRVYQFEENRFNGPYPAQFVVVSIRILGGASRNELFDRLDEAVRSVLEQEGVELDPDSRREGSRVLRQGQESLWFTYEARSQASGFFSPGREIRILGEVFNDQRSDLTVLLIGLAQVTGNSILEGSQDTSQWSRIVGDPQGTIEGFRGSEGLAYNVVSHGA